MSPTDISDSQTAENAGTPEPTPTTQPTPTPAPNPEETGTTPANDTTPTPKTEAEEEKEEEKEEEPKIMKPEVKRLVNRYDKETGLNTTVEAAHNEPGTEDKWAYTAICVTNLFNYRNELTRRVLEIKAPLLKDVLKTVIGDGYPGVSFKTSRVILNYPLRSLFHNLEGIEEECAKQEKICSEEDKKFFPLLVDFLREELKDDMANVRSLLPEGRVTYDLYVPDTLLGGFC